MKVVSYSFQRLPIVFGSAFFAFVLAIGLIFTCYGQRKAPKPRQKGGVEVIPVPSSNRVDIRIDGKLFTSYHFPGTGSKPVLWPVSHSDFNTIPEMSAVSKLPGLWANRSEIQSVGPLFHKTIDDFHSGAQKGDLTVTSEYRNGEGMPIAIEKTIYMFEKRAGKKLITKRTEIQALTDTLVLNRTREELMYPSLLESPGNKSNQLSPNVFHSNLHISPRLDSLPISVFEQKHSIAEMDASLADSALVTNPIRLHIPPRKPFFLDHRIVIWTGEKPDRKTILQLYADWAKEKNPQK